MIKVCNTVAVADQHTFQSKGQFLAAVMKYAVAYLVGEVQPFSCFFQNIYLPQALAAVVEAGIKLVQSPLSNMAEGRVAQIMSQGNGLCKIFIQA